MKNNFESQVEEKTDDELVELFLNASDYQSDFIKQVEAQIVKRNIPLNSLKSIKEQKDSLEENKIEIGKQGSQFWLVFYLMGSLFTYGILGIVGGYQYTYSKHTNTDGDEFFVYNDSTRKYGKWISIIGGVILGLKMFMLIYP